jgi:acetyl esterase/lipase
MLRIKFVLLLLSLTFSLGAFAQLSPTAIWAVEAETKFTFTPNVPYITENDQEMFLDVYSQRDGDAPKPTMVFFHGGFWMAGSKDNQLTAIMPWLEMGWNVVTVGYRLGNVALAPAAMVDSFCALRFVGANAERYNFDTSRIVTSGQSAGGHLALSMAMLGDAGFDSNCPAGDAPQVAAVVNWFGVTDVPDVIDGENRSDFAAGWFGDMNWDEALALAERLSPLNYVRDDLPPILTIQGDADNVVPYAEGVALHVALENTNVLNQLLTIPGGGHGRFNAAERRMIYANILDFLDAAGL